MKCVDCHCIIVEDAFALAHVFGRQARCTMCAWHETIDACPGCEELMGVDDEYCSPECEQLCLDRLTKLMAKNTDVPFESLTIADVADVLRI